jgi:Flp pilus assembly protein TadD
MALLFSRELLRSASKIAIAAAAAGFLAGCSGAGTYSTTDTGSPSVSLNGIEPDSQDYVGGAAYWGAKYEANRGDLTAAISFARNLRLMGGARQSVAVLKEVVMKAPDDPRVLSEYGKSLTAAGRVQDALPFLVRSIQINSDDWTTLSAYGVALDQSSNHQAAREQYQAALRLSKGNPSIESNLAMSYVLEGNIDQAETIMRRLVARPDATPQMRQNLSMIAAIKGNTAEAEQLAREDLQPTDAQNNLTVLQQLDAHNVAINVQPLAAPQAQQPAPSAKPAPVMSTPVGDNADNLKPGARASADPQSTKTLAPTPAAPKASLYTMEPIAEPDEVKPAAAAQPAATPSAAPSTMSNAPAQTTEVAPAPEAKPVADATAKPTPMLRKSYDVYRRSPKVEVANASQ